MEVKELGHLVLYVRDLEHSRRFYGDLLGWREVARLKSERSDRGILFSSGRTHHELLLVEAGQDAVSIPAGKRVGLQHFGLKIGESDDELREALKQLEAAGVAAGGFTDHGVSHSAYVKDPDGNEIELYIDVQPEVWHDDPGAIVKSMKPLKL